MCAGNRLLTPQLIVEVLSQSTSTTDAGQKLEAYVQIPSLLEYWIVAQEHVRVIRYYRTPAGWITRVYSDLDDTIDSDSLGIDVLLRELYRGVVED